MYLSPDDHQANDDAREHLVRALKQVPCKPFDVDPETDDEPEPDTGDATKDDEDADVGADTDDSAKDDEDADVGADTTASIKKTHPHSTYCLCTIRNLWKPCRPFVLCTPST